MRCAAWWRAGLWVFVFAFSAGPVVVAAQDQPEERDPTTERVERGEEEYEQRTAHARDELIEALNEAVYRAADQGDLEELEALEAQRAAFEEDGELPPSREVRREALAYHRAMERAKDDLLRVYERAVRDYTRERRITMARITRTKIGLLRVGDRFEIVPYDGHFYALIPEKKTWLEARAICSELGGYLVCISSEEENQFVAGLIPEEGHCWLGATDMQDQGVWVWTDGSDFAYSNWGPGEPSGGDRQDSLWMGRAGLWDDFWDNFGGITCFVCEWEGLEIDADQESGGARVD